MHIIDSHFHWWPRSVFDKLCKRRDFPKARVNTRGGYDYMRRQDSSQHLNSWAEWFDLDKQFEYMASSATGSTWSARSARSRSSFSDMPLDRRPRLRADVERGDGGRAEEISRPVMGERGGAAAGHPRRDRSGRRRGQSPRPHGRQSARQRRRRCAHRRRAAGAVLRPRREARPAAVPASDRRRSSRTCSTATTARCI